MAIRLGASYCVPQSTLVGCVAVVDAIDCDGNLVHFKVKDQSIKKEDFQDFLNEIAEKQDQRESFIFLDNLRAHHSLAVKATA